MERRPLKTRSKPWVGSLKNILMKTKMMPDHVSILGMVFATIGAILLLFQKETPDRWLYLLVAVFIQLRLLCNMMDGILAVEGDRKGRLGIVYNEVPDRFEDIVLLVSAGYAAGLVTLGWIVATLAVLTAYIRNFGGTLGQEQTFIGPMAKPHRMFVLTAACLVEFVFFTQGRILFFALIIIAVGCLWTFAKRLILITENIKDDR